MLLGDLEDNENERKACITLDFTQCRCDCYGLVGVLG